MHVLVESVTVAQVAQGDFFALLIALSPQIVT
jgi:hypothetical protein